MRPLRLDLAGFTVFREPVTIDFTDADFFALVGPTGSGKSTVLDAICFALYGTVPRWGDRRAIGNALAPSATEARVRLVFESAGARYVLTRVVRRDGKGSVATRQAGLEALPTGFDLSRFDTGLSGSDLGEVLAGTASEVDSAVAAVIGLPYEQFTKCVVLPQGEFAAFLHAKPAERQKILVNLLSLDVYGRVRERASALAAEAGARALAAEQVLGSLTDADDAAVEAARSRVEELRALVAAVERILPELAAARGASAEARSRLGALDAEISQLTRVRVPESAREISAAAVEARIEVASSGAAVALAEEREEKVRAALAATGDGAEPRRLLDGHAEAASLAERAAAHATQIASVEAEHADAVTRLSQARHGAEAARAALDAARELYQAALATDRAASLRSHLRVGLPCPVCEHPVTALPSTGVGSAAADAEARGHTARKASDAADALVAERDQTARALELRLTAVRAEGAQLSARQSELRARLCDAPSPETLRQRVDEIVRLERDLADAADAVRGARARARRALQACASAEERIRNASRAFDATRDGLASHAPPLIDRDDLAAAWEELVSWASDVAAGRRAERPAAVTAVTKADQAAAAAAARVAALFASAGVASPASLEAASGASDGGDAAKDAAVALAEAEGVLRRRTERRADAERLRAARSEAEREAVEAKGLATHLRADRFERWLLTEALDSLVDGASRILRELSAGQYDLGHDRGEFYVIDHHDAGLRRAVRTLSGGETFQASLALALALSEQLAGVATTASLESIVLDEGFGTLDSSTLDTVTATLENLAAKGDRMVGVVTHVAPLAERIPIRFEVRRDARTATVERVGL